MRSNRAVLIDLEEASHDFVLELITTHTYCWLIMHPDMLPA